MKTKDILISVLVVVVAGAVLFCTRSALASTAADNRAAEAREMMTTLLPGGETFTAEEYTGEDESISAVWKGETGYVIETVVDGYAGSITVWTGVDNRGAVTGLVVRDMGETWGLGRRALTDVSFLDQFVGTAGTAVVGEGVDALTGATVTSKAIAKAVNAASAFVTGADTSTSATEWGG